MDDKEFWNNPFAVEEKFFETFPLGSETKLSMSDPEDLKKIDLYHIFVDTTSVDIPDLPTIYIMP